MTQIINYEEEFAKDNDAMINLYKRTIFDGEDILDALNKKRLSPPSKYPVTYKEDTIHGETYMLTELCDQHPLGDLIHKRRSHRQFSKQAIPFDAISEILHYTAGRIPDIYGDHCVRVHPSAGSLYPVDTYLITRNDETIKDGWHLYSINSHALITISDNVETDFIRSTFGLQDPPNYCIVWVAALDRLFHKYAANAYRFACLEAGHMAQNTSLILQYYGMGGFCIGGFDNNRIADALNLGEFEWPVYAMAFGKPQGSGQGHNGDL